MTYVSLRFLATIVGSLVLFHAHRGRTWRLAVLAATSAVFVGSFVDEPIAAAPLVGFVLLGYCLIAWAQSRPGPVAFGVAVALVVAVYAYLKQYTLLGFVPRWEPPYAVVGLSYILFRVLHLAIDVRQGALAEPVSLAAYARYALSLLTFVSGPIQRYEEFRAQEDAIDRRELTAEAAHAGASRMADGALKLCLVAAAFQALHQRCVHELTVRAPGSRAVIAVYAVAALAYLVYLYANFSGSIDMVCGLARLYGFELPENFDRPLVARNLLDLWSRWHITLSQWFKFYVFNPTAKLLARRTKSPRGAAYTGVVAYFVTFLLMGLWHGTTGAFAVYGVLLGAGVALTKLYELELVRRLGKQRSAQLRARAVVRALEHGLSLAFFALALTCFWMDAGGLSSFARGAGAVHLVLAWLAATAIVVAAAIGAALAGRLIGPAARATAALRASFVSRQLWLSGRVFLVTCVVFVSNFQVPDLVYRAF